MTARILTGSKDQIAEQVAEIEGDIREAIVFVDEFSQAGRAVEDVFVEMEPFMVRQARADDSRDAIYQRTPSE